MFYGTKSQNNYNPSTQTRNQYGQAASRTQHNYNSQSSVKSNNNNKAEILQTGRQQPQQQNLIDPTKKFKKRSNSPQSNTNSIFKINLRRVNTPTTIQNIPASLHKVNVIQPIHSQKAPQTMASNNAQSSSRRVVNYQLNQLYFSQKFYNFTQVNIHKDKDNEYEEMKVGGTIESSDEDEDYNNPFQLPQTQDILNKQNNVKFSQQQQQQKPQQQQTQSKNSQQRIDSSRNSIPVQQKSQMSQQYTGQQQAIAQQQKVQQQQQQVGRLTQGPPQTTANATELYKIFNVILSRFEKFIIKQYIYHKFLWLDNSNQFTLRYNSFIKLYKKKVNQYLIHAAETGNTDSVQDALNKQKYGQYTADINSHNKEDWTTLHFAVSEGHFNIAQMNNADVNALTAAKRTPLHIACIRGRPDYAKLLLIKGADVNIQDIDGNTPVHYASEYGHKDILVLLLQKQPDLKIRNVQGKSAVDVSSSNRIFAVSVWIVFLKNNQEDIDRLL